VKEIIGWKLYYGDGTVVCSMQAYWSEAPSHNIQVLIVFFQETYRIHRDGDWYEDNYRDLYFGHDYFWQFGNGRANDVPEDAEVKIGKELPQDEWRLLYNQAQRDMKWLQI